MAEKAVTAYLIAGEASGDLLGAHLMKVLKARLPGVKFHGVGGPRMAAEGLSSLFPFTDLSLFGFVEILPHIFTIAARIDSAVEDILAKRPDIVITIDVPGFSFRVVERLRKEKLAAKFVHYVAPTVWAYKPERAALCARLFDHMLVLLPFEPPYFEREGLACSFIGHAAVAETEAGDGKAFREKYGIAADTTLLCLLPGSRKNEIRRHMPIFARALTLLSAKIPNLAMAVAVPKNVLGTIAPYFEGCPFRAVVTAQEEDKKNALAGANLAITKSGTITLEIAQAGTPMIVAHKLHPVSAWWLKRQMKVPHVTLLNLLQEKEIIPELLQESCAPQRIAETALALLENPQAQIEQRDAAKKALAMLVPTGTQTPSERAATIILQLLNK